jgi:dihydrofolate reductase
MHPAPSDPRPLSLVLIAAVARNGAIGHAGDLLWRLPEDMAFFRRTTMGHPVVMGRKTWDSVPARFKPLPGRTNIVITRQRGWHEEGAIAVHDLDAALDRAHAVVGTNSDNPRVFVIGGAQLYAQALPRADELLLTEIDRDFEGDAHFPAWKRADFVELARERHRAAAPNDFDFEFATYRRKSAPPSNPANSVD